MRTIDADYVLGKIGEYAMHPNEELVNNLAIAFDIVVDAPTIDAVEVVRCKDCVFSEVYQNDSSGVMGRFCEAFTQVRMVSDDDFCSYGERKTEK